MKPQATQEESLRIFWMFLLIGSAVSAESIEPWRVISSITDSWSDDAFIDRAILVQVDDEDLGPVLDLIIYSENDETYAFDEVARIKDVAWQGRMWGMHATMKLNESGSIQIYSGNDAIGHNRWHEILTVAYRDGAFRVAGYYNDWYDTLDLANSGSCDLNFLNGKGIVKYGEEGDDMFSHTIPALELTQWDRAEAAALCREHLPEF